MKPEKLQAKLNSWVGQVEKQVKQMEKKLTRKIKMLEDKHELLRNQDNEKILNKSDSTSAFNDAPPMFSATHANPLSENEKLAMNGYNNT